jgi:hypothetical protein
MVGWSRRRAEDDERERRYRRWFNSLPPEEQEKIKRENAERWKRERPGFIVIMILTFLMMFVGWPLAAMHLSRMRWQRFWDNGKIVSQDAKQICKEVEYCAPCSPIHHWHKKVFCGPIDRNK